MAEKVPVTMAELVQALGRIEKWAGDVRQLLSTMDGTQVVANVEAPVVGSLNKDGRCPPPEEG